MDWHFSPVNIFYCSLTNAHRNHKKQKNYTIYIIYLCTYTHTIPAAHAQRQQARRQRQCIILYNRAKLFLKALDNIIYANKRNGHLRFTFASHVCMCVRVSVSVCVCVQKTIGTLYGKWFMVRSPSALTTFFALILAFSRLHIARHFPPPSILFFQNANLNCVYDFLNHFRDYFFVVLFFYYILLFFGFRVRLSVLQEHTERDQLSRDQRT